MLARAERQRPRRKWEYAAEPASRTGSCGIKPSGERPCGLFFAAGRDLEGRLYFPRAPVVKIPDAGEATADSRDVAD